MRTPWPRAAAAVLLAIAVAGCATGGLHRVAVASEQAMLAAERIQLSADDLERTGAMTKAQRDALSPYLIKVAQLDLALNAAVRAGDAPTVQAQTIALLAVLDQVQREQLTALPPTARAVVSVAIESLRAVVIIMQAEVAR